MQLLIQDHKLQIFLVLVLVQFGLTMSNVLVLKVICSLAPLMLLEAITVYILKMLVQSAVRSNTILKMCTL